MLNNYTPLKQSLQRRFRFCPLPVSLPLLLPQSHCNKKHLANRAHERIMRGLVRNDGPVQSEPQASN